MSYRACACDCHQDAVADAMEASHHSGFAVREVPAARGYRILDPIEAVTAGPSCCINDHVPVLLNRAVWSNRPTPDPLAWLAIQPHNTPKAD
jgi:hypothetical protein